MWVWTTVMSWSVGPFRGAACDYLGAGRSGSWPLQYRRGSKDASHRTRRRKGADLARSVSRARTDPRNTRRLVAADLDQREPGPWDIRGLLSRVPCADGW